VGEALGMVSRIAEQGMRISKETTEVPLTPGYVAGYEKLSFLTLTG
jgi:hypothetical protein